MSLLTDAFVRLKAVIERVPGAHRLYKFATSRTGEGRVYAIRSGPLTGAVWKRYNALPYWYHRGLYEPHVSSLIASLLKLGDVYWDVGAHAGYHALVAARRVGSQGLVLAVEPDPDNCGILREQMALNEVEHCVVVEAAVTDREGTVTLLRQSKDSRIHALAGLVDKGEPIRVRGLTLDTLSKAYRRATLIKIDIEGAETFALPSSNRLFHRGSRPSHLIVSTHGADAMRVCKNLLEQHSYSVTVHRLDPRLLVASDQCTGHRTVDQGG